MLSRTAINTTKWVSKQPMAPVSPMSMEIPSTIVPTARDIGLFMPVISMQIVSKVKFKQIVSTIFALVVCDHGPPTRNVTSSYGLPR